MTQMNQRSFGVSLTPDFATRRPTNGALIGVTSGSNSDYSGCIEYCYDTLEALGIPYEDAVTSVHRTPDRAFAYARSAESRGLKLIIACAGGSAHLPGMMAALSSLPVLAVAPRKLEQDWAAPLSSIRMPSGAPLAFMGFEKAGAINAALAAAEILGLIDLEIKEKLEHYKAELAASVPWSCCNREGE